MSDLTRIEETGSYATLLTESVQIFLANARIVNDSKFRVRNWAISRPDFLIFLEIKKLSARTNYIRFPIYLKAINDFYHPVLGFS